ncbi:response regulator transcription factor [Endothiovibrio diazotrophicus]
MTEANTTLLLVDDQEDNLWILEEYLREYGFDLLTAQSGEACLTRAREGRPDLILLDVRMPGMDGFEACRRLKEGADTRAIPVVFVTAADELVDKVTGFQCGAVDYLTKPVAEAELVARIGIHLDQSKLQRRLEQRLEAYEDRYGSLQEGEAAAAALGEERDSHPRIARLYRAREVIMENLLEPPPLAEIARQVGTNPTTLSKEFQALFGFSVIAYAREQRLQRARRALERSEKPVNVIAHEVGYRHDSDFVTAFRKRFGVTPKNYRIQGLG